MRTITIKLPEDDANDLDKFIKERNYPSKSEFIRHLIMEKLDKTKKEKMGWLVVAEQSFEKLWNNKNDEIWNNI